MRVDLRLRLHLSVHQTEGWNRPIQVLAVPIALPQRKLLTKGRLVDLDDLDTVLFEVKHLVTDGETNLLRLLLQGDILTRERPVQDGDRSREHSLDRLVGLALRENRPFHRDWCAAMNVAPHYRWLNATRSVALHPCVLGEDEAVQVVAEVLHHVVALKLTVHQDIQSEALLQCDALGDLLAVELLVLLGRDGTLLEGGSIGAHVRRLREGPDGCRRVRRQFENILLDLLALAPLRQTGEVSFGQLA